jgi:acetyl-CoA carboxylase biotin carboxyl carrier protein
MLYWPSFAPRLPRQFKKTVNTPRSPMARIEVKSEITGTVWQVKASPGDKVDSGDVLVVIESMKMEIPVITEDPGVVKQILVKEKDAVAEGQVVAILED